MFIQIPKSSGVIASINGDANPNQTITTGTAGTSPNVSTASGVTTINLPLASAGGVTAGLISSTDQSLIGTIGGKSARTTRFISIGSGTSGTVTPPTLSTIVLADFGGTVNALVCGITGGRPDFTPALTASGVVIATSFDSSGNYVFTGTPSAYPVAILYRVSQALKDFDSTATNIVGSVDFDNGALHQTNNLSDLASANTALNNILPTQTANSGKFLTTNGTNTSWATASGGGSPLTTKGDLFGYDTAGNRIPVGADGTVLQADSTQALGVKWAASSGSGTVTSASVVSANGFAGTVATPTTTPAITLTTSVTGVLKGNGTAISAAVSGTDYVLPSGSITGSAASFTGSLAGDVTGTQSTTAISASTVTGKALTGFVSGAGTVSATDSILTALNKHDGTIANNTAAIALKAPIASPTFTGTVTSPAFSGPLTGNVTGNITGTSANVTAASNSTLTTLSALSLPNTQVTGLGTASTQSTGTFAQVANNLSDLASAKTARVNLNLDKFAPVADTNYTILATDKIIAVTSLTATRTITLPAANTVNAGQLFFIIDSNGSITSTNQITVAANGADTINGSASHTMSVANGELRIISDGTSKWSYDVVGIKRGGTGVTSVTSTPTASSFAGWDANKNFNANSYIRGVTTTATAAGTTTLTVSSTQLQRFTGTTTQTVVLPDATTMLVGASFIIANRSTGVVTVNANGGGLLLAMPAGSQTTYTVSDNSTTAGTWDFTASSGGGSGTVTSVTFTGDGTVLSSTPSTAVTTSGTVTASLNTQTANTVFAGPSSGSAANPTFRSLVIADQVATSLQYFGNGVDGAFSPSSGTTTFVRDMYYSNLTLSGTAVIKTSGYRLHVRGTLDLTACQAGGIQFNGLGGGAGAGTGTAGTAGATSAASVTIGGSAIGGAGAAGGTGVGVAGLNSSSNAGGLGGGSGGAGAGGAGTSGAGGTAGTSSTPGSGSICRAAVDLLRGIALFQGGNGGSGGGSGAGDGTVAGGGGGGGGSSAGLIGIWANTIARGGSTAVGCISAQGGAGGGGGHPASGTGPGGGGGGCGGGAGVVYILFNTLTGSTATNAIDLSGGAGGTAGTGNGTGSSGTGGKSGGQGRATIVNLGANTLTDNVGTTSTYNSPSGVTGATINTFQVSL